MKKEPDIEPEYDFRGGERGKYASRFERGTNLVALDADLLSEFPDSRSVNDALRTLLNKKRKPA